MLARILEASAFQQSHSFSQIPYLCEAGGTELFQLEQLRSVHRFRDGQKVPLSYGGISGFFCLHEGYVKLICRTGGHDETIRVAGPKDIVGFARWHGPRDSYWIVALSPVTASFIRKDGFLEIQNSSPSLANQVSQWVMAVLIEQEERMIAMKRSTAKERVTGILASLCRRFGTRIGGNNSENAAPIDRRTLAELAGVAIEVLSRVLAELETDQVIAREGRVIVIRDLCALDMLASH